MTAPTPGRAPTPQGSTSPVPAPHRAPPSSTLAGLLPHPGVPASVLQAVFPHGPRASAPPHDHLAQLRRLISVIAALSTLSALLLGFQATRMTLAESRPLVIVAYVSLFTIPLFMGAFAVAGLLRQGTREAVRYDRVRDVLVVLLIAVFASMCAVSAAQAGLPAVSQFTLSSSQSLLSNLLITVVVASPVVLDVRSRFVYFGACVVLIEVASLHLPDTPAHTAAIGPIINIAPVLMYLGAATWVLHQAANLDAASRERRAKEEETADENARIEARRRVNDFVHDHILSALIPAATGMPAGPELAETARRALSSLDGASGEPTPTSGVAFAAEIASHVGALDAHTRVSTHVASGEDLPGDVARAALEAVSEAVINSRRHAGTGAGTRRAVDILWTAEGLDVTVTDDGPGFDPNRLAPGRRGIPHSIIGRMAAVGGHARVTSSPGRGTVVRLVWEAPGRSPRDLPVGSTRAEAASLHPVGAAPVVHAPGAASVSTPPPGPPGATPSPSALVHTTGTTPPRGAASRPRRRGTPLPWDARVATSMQTTGARVIAGVVLVVTGITTVASAEAYTHLLPVAAAFLLCATAGVVLLWTWPHAELPDWAALGVPVAIGVANGLVLSSIPADGWPMYEAWSLGAGSNLCCALVMRERSWSAWAGIAALFVSTLGWVVLGHQPLVLAVAMIAGHVVIVSLWSLTATWSAHASTDIAAELDRHSRALAHAKVQDETVHQMERTLDSVGRRARPLLERIASGEEPGDDLRRRARLLEAELRDEIRASSFTGTAVVSAAKAARARGVDVVLLDDSGAASLAPGVRDLVVGRACDVLARTTEGRVIVRLQPPGRRVLATIVTDTEHVSVPAPPGSVRTRATPAG